MLIELPMLGIKVIKDSLTTHLSAHHSIALPEHLKRRRRTMGNKFNSVEEVCFYALEAYQIDLSEFDIASDIVDRTKNNSLFNL